MNPLKKLAEQTVVYGLSSVIGRLLNYLLVPLYTRFFAPEDYGVVTELYAYVAFLVILLTYGLETAFFRFSKAEKNTAKAYSTALVSLIVSSCVFVFLALVSSESIANYMGAGIKQIYIQYFAVIVSLDAVSSITFAKLRQDEKAFRFATVKLFGVLVNIALNVYFILFKELLDIEYIFISNLISSIVTIFLLFPQMLISKISFDKTLWKKMMAYGLPLLIAGLAGMTNETIDRILLKHLLPIEDSVYQLGIYGALYKLSIIMILFIQTFRFAAEPFFFDQHNSSNDRSIYSDVMKYFVVVMGVIFLAVIIFYEFIIGFLGPAYRDHPDGFEIVSILLIANLFLGVLYNLSIWYKLTEKTIFGAYISIFGAIITVVLNFSLIPKIGILGSAWATLMCYFSMTILSYFLGKKYFPIPYQTSRIVFYLGVILALYFVIVNFDLNTAINTLFLLGFVIFVYVFEKNKKQKITL
ncbi:MAG: polysaccharide biosynthesis protein [Flavobacteriales bacterium]|nr:polysaccharide biosynthesis protein [Flavobacteriales bacterium]